MLKRPLPFSFSMADSLPCHIPGLSFFPKTQPAHFQGKISSAVAVHFPAVFSRWQFPCAGNLLIDTISG
jgi:hypothetical protein